MTPDEREILHLAVETVLAGLWWVLYRRANAWRRALTALEAEVARTRQKSEAETASLHLRLHAIERLAKAVRPPAPEESLRARAAAGGNGTPAQLSRGELDLLMKIRRLREK